MNTFARLFGFSLAFVLCLPATAVAQSKLADDCNGIYGHYTDGRSRTSMSRTHPWMKTRPSLIHANGLGQLRQAVACGYQRRDIESRTAGARLAAMVEDFRVLNLYTSFPIRKPQKE